jgi:proline iminopeptidase
LPAHRFSQSSEKPDGSGSHSTSGILSYFSNIRLMPSQQRFSVVTLLLLVSFLSAGCAHTRAQPRDPATVRLAVREGYVPLGDSVRLYYRSIGEGADTVVVLHGGPGFHLNMIAPDLTPLAAHRTLLFFDQRNAGRSTLLRDTARATAQHLVDDLEALRRHFGLRRLTLLGHSWGGLLAGLYAVQHPERVERLLLVGPMPASADAWRGFNPFTRLDSIANQDRVRNLRAYHAGAADSTKACWDYYALWARGYVTAPVQARRMWGDLCNVPQTAMLNPTRGYPLQSLGNWDIRPELSKVHAPVLVLHGEQDPVPLSSAKAWVDALPNARLFAVPNSGHVAFVDQPAVFFTAAQAFLGGGWPDSSAFATKAVAVVLPGDRQRSAYLAVRADVAELQNELTQAIALAAWDSVARVYAEDAIIFAPGAPPVAGRQAIASFWRTVAKRGMRTLELQLMDMEVSGDLLEVVGKYAMRGEQGQILDVGKFLSTYRKVDGRWRPRRESFNSTMETRSPLEVPDYLTLPSP